ncbi:hypothetical protein L6164_005638 [Bauhinia variegata]|uniref:Uncharacterized protein n=1 Tax=Bauhinia variegata TaxID=167791 RepID=A0ACB9PRS5_BAUVA|nr:hypothetical protein L6164_005638 [Bauhinia variegata]
MLVCSRPRFAENNYGISLLDLPDSILECILKCLSPREVCKLATLCTFLRDICRSESLWEKLMKQKWGNVIGNVAYKEWQKFIALKNIAKLMGKCNPFESFGSLHDDWPILTINGSSSSTSWPWSASLPDDSLMALCIALETGRFWFPAQIYHKENTGLLLYWYDGLLSYDFQTDTFRARYPHDGWKTTLRNITWDRVRAAVVDNSPYVIHISDCLNDLKPGNHIEIQWRWSQRDPYDWWYAVIGHLESCEDSKNHCHCCYRDELIVEFNQYPLNSRWRRAMLNRKEYKEQGNPQEGFYGGIRKLQNQEIAMRKTLSSHADGLSHGE